MSDVIGDLELLTDQTRHLRRVTVDDFQDFLAVGKIGGVERRLHYEGIVDVERWHLQCAAILFNHFFWQLVGHLNRLLFVGHDAVNAGNL